MVPLLCGGMSVFEINDLACLGPHGISFRFGRSGDWDLVTGTVDGSWHWRFLSEIHTIPNTVTRNVASFELSR